MNDTFQFVYWYYIGGVVLLALLGVGILQWYKYNEKH